MRFDDHRERFNRLAELTEAGQADPSLVEELYERDKLFPNIDYRCLGIGKREHPLDKVVKSECSNPISNALILSSR